MCCDYADDVREMAESFRAFEGRFPADAAELDSWVAAKRAAARTAFLAMQQERINLPL